MTTQRLEGHFVEKTWFNRWTMIVSGKPHTIESVGHYDFELQTTVYLLETRRVGPVSARAYRVRRIVKAKRRDWCAEVAQKTFGTCSYDSYETTLQHFGAVVPFEALAWADHDAAQTLTAMFGPGRFGKRELEALRDKNWDALIYESTLPPLWIPGKDELYDELNVWNAILRETKRCRRLVVRDIGSLKQYQIGHDVLDRMLEKKRLVRHHDGIVMDWLWKLREEVDLSRLRVLDVAGGERPCAYDASIHSYDCDGSRAVDRLLNERKFPVSLLLQRPPPVLDRERIFDEHMFRVPFEKMIGARQNKGKSCVRIGFGNNDKVLVAWETGAVLMFDDVENQEIVATDGNRYPKTPIMRDFVPFTKMEHLCELGDRSVDVIGVKSHAGLCDRFLVEARRAARSLVRIKSSAMGD